MFSRPKNRIPEQAAVPEPFASAPVTPVTPVAPAAAADEAAAAKGAQPGAGFLLDRNKPSVISEGFSLVGDISASGALHVEGHVKGTIATDVVNIGPGGAVEGEVVCRAFHIKGTFVGHAECDELYIAGKASVNGRVTYRTLSVQRGAGIEASLVRVT